MWLNQTDAKKHKISGIYQIRTDEKSCYIGSSNNIHKRFIDHRWELSKGVHCNNRLQNSYNKYQRLEVRILATCPPEYLIKLEQWCLDNLLLNSTLNVVRVAGSRLKPPTKEETRQKLSMIRKGRVFSEETRTRISDSKKGSKNGMFGRKRSPEALAKFKEKMTGRKRNIDELISAVLNRKGRQEFAIMYNGKNHYALSLNKASEILGVTGNSLKKHLLGEIKIRKSFIIYPCRNIITPEFYVEHREKFERFNIVPSFQEYLFNTSSKLS